MKTHLALLPMLYALLAAPAAAEPCVGPAYDRPFPDAVDVSIHHADVPAVHFPGIWQDGMIDGQFYQIFANRLAVLKAERTAPAWLITVNCQQRPCSITVVGSPPPTALNTSKRLEQCLVPPEMKTATTTDRHNAPIDKAPTQPAPDKAAPRASTPEPVARAKPAPKTEPDDPADPGPEQKLPPRADAAGKPSTVAETYIGNAPLAAKSGDDRLEPTAPDATKPASSGQPIARTGTTGTEITCPTPQSETTPVVAMTCRPAVVSGSDPVATLQQLLVMAGANPGTVDGHYGSRTKKAVLEVLGYRGKNLAVPEAISAVDALLCGK